MVKFGIVAWKTFDFRPYSYDMIKKLAVEGERLGFESFWLSDHLHAANPTDPCYECYTTLSALASETRRIRLGPLVTCVSYRSPSILAKMGATLDVISGGRLEFALGAGWDLAEYTAYGIPFPPSSVRVQQVEEGLQIVRKMWTEAESSFEGRYFTIRKAVNEPKPLQKPHPPIWLGTKSKNMLKLVAKYADGWNIDVAFTPDIYRQKLNILTESCKAVGRDADGIRKSIATEIILAKTEGEVKELVDKYSSRFSIKPEDCFYQRMVGTPEQIAEKLRKYVDLGVDLVIGYFINGHTLRPIELFSEKVIPNV